MQTSIITDASGIRLIVDADSEIERSLIREMGGPLVAIKMNGSQLVVRRSDTPEDPHTVKQAYDEADREELREALAKARTA